MKITSKLFAFTFALMLSLTLTSFAGTKEKVLAKATEAVENGAPDDWMLLAKQAAYLIKRGAGLSTAKEWIEKSLAIKEDAYNLEVFGDYYLASSLPADAIGYYIKSADALKANDPNASTYWLQEKMATAAKMR